MAALVNGNGLTKSFGAVALFRGIAFPIDEGDRVGLIGPNGSGKSTLLGILGGEIEPDEGEVVRRKLTRLSYVPQVSEFSAGFSVREIVTAALRDAAVPESEWEARLADTMGRAGFEDFETEAASLSGGWKKRLSIARALATHPDVLLLDEPTNHLDLAGIEWLEELLESASFACVVISHDRYFLENVATEIVELNRQYPQGLLRVHGKYSEFLIKKEEFLEAQSRRQEALENRVKQEIEWLRRGPKARTTKSKARIGTANEMIGELREMKGRAQVSTAAIDFSASDRQTKRLVEISGLRYSIGERQLFSGMDFNINAGMRIGLVGANGSGKSTLLRLLMGQIDPEAGEIKRAPMLRLVHFDQTRVLDETLTLRRALAPESDSVVYQDRVIHVASWASRFLFTGEQLNQPVERLSGGERARVLIAKLMLQPADLLLLDEPTNDLDIPTLEILEESLLEYSGALVLVTHDRYMLDRVSNVVLGLDGLGNAARFADYGQWEEWLAAQKREKLKPTQSTSISESTSHKPSVESKKKLSYIDARDYATIEQRIASAEADLTAKKSVMEQPDVVINAARLQTALTELESAQQAVDALYARWAELEEKLS
ncbi:ABC-F family ATP-binding cassette domain-containing protein [Acidicapsa dinghuensis]|uniref:ABC-F family ATP-binding cassette domain-containing protein n=1 Tax=Acidicapsa dinghuensis TaxID=2218256 RepID=A0ABW1EFC0_9BACT|nr:ABC-F family ATP-binding cassette domain-containing protein [Acidicapsa dinghuensis]